MFTTRFLDIPPLRAVSGTVRVPGGKPVAIVMGVLGFLTTAVSMVLAALPPEDAKNAPLAVGKVIGGTLLLVAVGSLLYARGRARAQAVGRGLSG
jgi:hypothetical protein